MLSATLRAGLLMSACWGSMAFAIDEPKDVHKEDQIALIPAFKVGDSITLELIKSRSVRNGDRPSQIHESRTPVTITVAERTDGGAMLRFEFGPTELLHAKVAVPAGIGELMAQGMHYEVVMDNNWNIVELRNWEDIQRKMLKLIDDLLSGPVVKDLTETQQQKVRQALRPVFERRDTGEAAVLREVYTYCFVLGWHLTLAVDNTKEESLPNPLGGQPLPAILTLRVTEFDPGKRARVETDRQFDKEKVPLVLSEMLEKLSGTSAAKLKEELPNVDVHDQGVFVMDLTTGWPVEARQKRQSISGDRTQIDVIHWRIPPAAAPAPAATTPIPSPRPQ